MGAFKDILANVIWNTIDTFVIYIYIYTPVSELSKG